MKRTLDTVDDFLLDGLKKPKLDDVVAAMEGSCVEMNDDNEDGRIRSIFPPMTEEEGERITYGTACRPDMDLRYTFRMEEWEKLIKSYFPRASKEAIDFAYGQANYRIRPDGSRTSFEEFAYWDSHDDWVRFIQSIQKQFNDEKIGLITFTSYNIFNKKNPEPKFEHSVLIERKDTNTYTFLQNSNHGLTMVYPESAKTGWLMRKWREEHKKFMNRNFRQLLENERGIETAFHLSSKCFHGPKTEKVDPQFWKVRNKQKPIEEGNPSYPITFKMDTRRCMEMWKETSSCYYISGFIAGVGFYRTCPEPTFFPPKTINL